MKIKTALILYAGLGKRVLPLSLETPKPLLKLNNITLLENTINLLEALKIENIKLNTFYLQNQIKDFFSNQKFKAKIEIIEDGKKILDTGGGIYNLIKASDDENFLVLNPDTIWSLNYLETIKNMQKFYFEKKILNLLMVVSKNKSFDKRFKGSRSGYGMGPWKNQPPELKMFAVLGVLLIMYIFYDMRWVLEAIWESF